MPPKPIHRRPPPKKKQQAQSDSEGEDVDPQMTNQPKKKKHKSTHLQFMVSKDVNDPRCFVQGVNKILLARIEQIGYPTFLQVAQVAQIPTRLPKGQEFAVGPMFDPAVIDEVCQNGFFPMTIGFTKELRMFAAKCHTERAITVFSPPSNTTELHETDPAKIKGIFRAQGGGTKRKAKNLRLLINQDWTFDPICRMIYEQHGEDWMCAPLRQCFYHMFRPEHSGTYLTKIHSFAIVREKKMEHSGIESCASPSDKYEILGGELGYTVGTIYTSLTGAYTEVGIGSVQLSAMGLVLEQLGYKMWDLGMQMKYKEEQLHSVEWSRSRWLKTVATERRNTVGSLALEGLKGSTTDVLCTGLYYKAEDSVMDPNSAKSRKKEAKKLYKEQCKAEKRNNQSSEKDDVPNTVIKKDIHRGKMDNCDSPSEKKVLGITTQSVYSPFLRTLFA